MVILASSYTTSVFRLVRISMIAVFFWAGCSLPRDVGTSAGSGRTAVFFFDQNPFYTRGVQFQNIDQA